MIIMLVGVGLLVASLAAWSFLAGKLVARWCDRRIEDEKAELALHIRSFIESPGDETPSPLALMADQFALLFAGRLWQHMEARIRGGNAATTKEMNEEEEAALAAANPGMALVAAFLPKKIKNMLKKNPMMLGALSNLVGAGGQPGGNHGADGGGSVVDRLKHRA